MTDDIVTRLRQSVRMCNHGFPNGAGPYGPDPTTCASCQRATEAADEIEWLREQHTTLLLAAGEEGRANRMTLLYESAQEEVERLRLMIREYVAAETAQYPSEGWTGSTTYEQVMQRAGRAWDTLVEEARRD